MKKGGRGRVGIWGIEVEHELSKGIPHWSARHQGEIKDKGEIWQVELNHQTPLPSLKLWGAPKSPGEDILYLNCNIRIERKQKWNVSEGYEPIWTEGEHSVIFWIVIIQAIQANNHNCNSSPRCLCDLLLFSFAPASCFIESDERECDQWVTQNAKT